MPAYAFCCCILVAIVLSLTLPPIRNGLIDGMTNSGAFPKSKSMHSKISLTHDPMYLAGEWIDGLGVIGAFFYVLLYIVVTTCLCPSTWPEVNE